MGWATSRTAGRGGPRAGRRGRRRLALPPWTAARTPIRCPVPGVRRPAACLLPPHSSASVPEGPRRSGPGSAPQVPGGAKDTLCRGRGLPGALALEVPSRVGRSGELFAGRGGFLGRRRGGCVCAGGAAGVPTVGPRMAFPVFARCPAGKWQFLRGCCEVIGITDRGFVFGADHRILTLSVLLPRI